MRPIFQCRGGSVALPDSDLVLVSREDGGNLIVNPPRPVWERSELSITELTLWSFLVAAAGKAMLQSLPQLENGCINYWEAGNWSLNERAAPEGPKLPRLHRQVHLHLFGRARNASHPSWQWGEAPRFPSYVDRRAWAAAFTRLNEEETCRFVGCIKTILVGTYAFQPAEIDPSSMCAMCGHPTPVEHEIDELSFVCGECSSRNVSD